MASKVDSGSKPMKGPAGQTGQSGIRGHSGPKGRPGPEVSQQELKKVNVLSGSTGDASEAEGMYLHSGLAQGMLFNKVVNLFKDASKTVSTSLLCDNYTYKECCVPYADQQDLSAYDALLLLSQTIQHVGASQLELISGLQTFVPKKRLADYRLAFALPSHGDMASTYSAAHDTVVSVASALDTTHGVVESVVHTVFNSVEEKDDPGMLDPSTSYLDYIRHASVSLMYQVLNLARFMNQCGIVSQATYESIQYGLSRFVDDHAEFTLGPDAKVDPDGISRYVAETCFVVSVYFVTMCVYKALRVSVKASLGDMGYNTVVPSMDSILNHRSQIL